ncbi:hypothetical protein ACNVED_12095 [Legionella sp. D16C41]|uniref:hypothetical protein n=1 Tax=Legionella sp. D16C41 TaxID=3402688 RepID=UPI003AF7E220
MIDNLNARLNKDSSNEELWIVKEFLKKHAILFKENELRKEIQDSKTDILFKNINFQVKKILYPDTYKAKDKDLKEKITQSHTNEEYINATVEEALEHPGWHSPEFLKELIINNAFYGTTKINKKRILKYPPEIRSQLDLLFFIENDLNEKRNFHKDVWAKITEKGNLILLFGIIGSGTVFYLFLKFQYSLFVTALGYPLLGISFAALTLAALSQNSYLYKIRIPGAATLAAWSYAIYLIHKPISVLIYRAFSNTGVDASSLALILIITFANIVAGWLLYTFIEAPFLKLREKIGKENANIVRIDTASSPRTYSQYKTL